MRVVGQIHAHGTADAVDFVTAVAVNQRRGEGHAVGRENIWHEGQLSVGEGPSGACKLHRPHPVDDDYVRHFVWNGLLAGNLAVGGTVAAGGPLIIVVVVGLVRRVVGVENAGHSEHGGSPNVEDAPVLRDVLVLAPVQVIPIQAGGELFDHRCRRHAKCNARPGAVELELAGQPEPHPGVRGNCGITRRNRYQAGDRGEDGRVRAEIGILGAVWLVFEHAEHAGPGEKVDRCDVGFDGNREPAFDQPGAFRRAKMSAHPDELPVRKRGIGRFQGDGSLVGVVDFDGNTLAFGCQAVEPDAVAVAQRNSQLQGCARRLTCGRLDFEIAQDLDLFVGRRGIGGELHRAPVLDLWLIELALVGKPGTLVFKWPKLPELVRGSRCVFFPLLAERLESVAASGPDLVVVVHPAKLRQPELDGLTIRLHLHQAGFLHCDKPPRERELGLGPLDAEVVDGVRRGARWRDTRRGQPRRRCLSKGAASRTQ